MALIWVSLATENVAAAVPPNWTALAPGKPLPVMMTFVLPAVGPWFGSIAATASGGRYVNWSAGLTAEVPPGVVTVTSTVPVPGGLAAVIWASLTTEKE